MVAELSELRSPAMLILASLHLFAHADLFLLNNLSNPSERASLIAFMERSFRYASPVSSEVKIDMYFMKVFKVW